MEGCKPGSRGELANYYSTPIEKCNLTHIAWHVVNDGCALEWKGLHFVGRKKEIIGVILKIWSHL